MMALPTNHAHAKSRAIRMTHKASQLEQQLAASQTELKKVRQECKQLREALERLQPSESAKIKDNSPPYYWRKSMVPAGQYPEGVLSRDGEDEYGYFIQYADGRLYRKMSDGTVKKGLWRKPDAE